MIKNTSKPYLLAFLLVCLYTTIASAQSECLTPELEQALLIFTAANGIIIAFGLLIYFMKRRMSRFSVTSLAAFNRERRTSMNMEHDELNGKAA